MADLAPHAGTDERLRIGRVGVGALDARAAGRLGMWTLILTEAFLFGYLLFGYYFMALQHGRDWLPAQPPEFRLAGPNTAVLLLSSAAVWYGERALRRGGRARALIGLALGLLLGMLFLGIQLLEWSAKPFGPRSGSYGSLYFVITGFHLAHVLAGLAMLATILLWTSLELFDARRNAPVGIAALYWHFVDAVWLAVFLTIYVTPRLGV